MNGLQLNISRHGRFVACVDFGETLCLSREQGAAVRKMNKAFSSKDGYKFSLMCWRTTGEERPVILDSILEDVNGVYANY
jgi:hypothetical protein